MITHARKTNPFPAHRIPPSESGSNAPTLAEKFPSLKSLRISLTYFSADGLQKGSELTYKVSLHHAGPVLSPGCRNAECVGGDFDLSQEVAKAVAARLKLAQGEIQCQGQRTNLRRAKSRCENLLRFRLNFTYL